MLRIAILCLLIFYNIPSRAQADHYAGEWQTITEFVPGIGNCTMNLQISESEKYILYPACLHINADSISGVYEMLLVRKNSRELSVSKNKYARSEMPFLASENSFLLNGLFDHSKDLKGSQTLTLISIHDVAPLTPSTAGLNDTAQKIVIALAKFMDKGPVIFTKKSAVPWTGEYKNRILIPSQSPAYFNLIDTFPLLQRSGIVSMLSDKKNASDVVSIALNGKIIFDQITLSKKKHTEEILLDTGMNILTLFADNFGSGKPNRAKLDFSFNDQKFSLDFTTKEDSAAGFITRKIYCSTEKFNETYMPLHGAEGYDPISGNEKIITSVATKSKQIQLALWDDAVEDGDTVSISIDGEWIVQHFPVKNKPQFIPVTLKPGRNTILFMADNLGSIPPNTSVLEIIDGKRRKSFTIETQVGERNLLRIFYDH